LAIALSGQVPSVIDMYNSTVNTAQITASRDVSVVEHLID